VLDDATTKGSPEHRYDIDTACSGGGDDSGDRGLPDAV
jgi:hypothetical protein